MNFTASAAVVRRLGDQLIRQPRQAFFELVKNAYDADRDPGGPQRTRPH